MKLHCSYVGALLAFSAVFHLDTAVLAVVHVVLSYLIDTYNG
jgi:hypothetical protein